ncbi:hypothetical protein [Aquibacillus rhizosphaerae]|uniref:Uncharacterized protein n=1 Tax=Aquibacillus rhizosphaerae TaxID=3051431 RepID=A0ABT7LAT3_9BACI|nr:hypothetical protein [Aquibacillus sp. LR5S19]MDL4842966.1 hypothetical protein [Aquibacillus sp. LR5S19]
MESFAPVGLMLSSIMFLIPIVITVLLLIWVYNIKKNSEIQVKQNNQMIHLLERIQDKRE